MREFVEGSGIYKIPMEDLPAEAWFVRDPHMKRRKTWLDVGDRAERPPLLHICERELDRDVEDPMWFIVTSAVRWNSYHGHYQCEGCKTTWGSEDTDGLKAIWSDGLGSGDEGLA